MPGKRKGKNQTVFFDPSAKILVKTYSQIENVEGDHYDIDYNKIMQKPPEYSDEDWQIINLVEFLHRMELLYTSCSLFCTTDTCPMFNAGPQYIYAWEDTDSSVTIQVSAPEYFSNLKRYIKRCLQDPSLIPSESWVKMSDEQHDVLKTCYRRLFRILAHLYICHFENISSIKEPNIVQIMNTILAHYSHFAIQNGLIEYKEVEMLQPVFIAINNNAGTNICPTGDAQSS